MTTQKGVNTSPSTAAIAVTPSNDADLSVVCRGIYIGGAGNVKVDMPGATGITFTALAVGVVHPIVVTKVYATGTTATNIVGLV